jgi:hypothetical protein
MSNFNKRIDTMGNILNYPQKPLVHTKLSKYTYSNELPAGVNVVVAIMTHTGFNQEDSIMINQSALDRGLFTSTYYKAFRDQCTKNHSTGEEEVFINPSEIAQLKPFSYKKLNEDGFIPKNTYIDGNDILVGKVMPKKQNGKIIYQDNSTCMKANDEGHIDLNYTGTNSDGYKFCKIRIRKNRKPEIGDKLACYSPDHEYLTTDGWIPVAELTLKHKDFEKLKEGSMWLYQVLSQNLQIPVLGPEEPGINRIRNEYIRTIMVKIPQDGALVSAKKTIQKILNSFEAVAQYRSIKVTLNVDFY